MPRAEAKTPPADKGDDAPEPAPTKSAVQAVLLDVVNDQRRREAVDALPFADPAAKIGRADIQGRHLHDVFAQASKFWRQGVPLKLEPRASYHQETYLVQEFVRFVPFREVIEHVSANEPPDLRPAATMKFAGGVDRVAGAAATKLDIVNLEARGRVLRGLRILGVH